MLSYRHSFHAGNHADVIKHLVLTTTLKSLTKKDKPAIYIDSHSGAGIYDLTSEEALKTGESSSGIEKLTEHSVQHETLKDYELLLAAYKQHNLYPGSPLIAANTLRQQDRLVLMEFHNNEVNNLKQNVRTQFPSKDISVHHRDGFEGLLALLPPQPSRGVVLIDPPYEKVEEYQFVSQTMKKALKKWANGIFIIWYPLLSARAQNKAGKSEAMVQEIAQYPVKNALNLTLKVMPNTADAGMYGSGLLILNAPWQLDEQLASAGDELRQLLAAEEGEFSMEWLAEGL